MTHTPGGATAVPVTREGFQQLQAGLAALRGSRRPEVVKQLQRARLFLDPATNEGAVAVAQGELELIDARIAWLEAQLADVEIIGDGPPPSTAQPGARVTVRYGDGTEETLTLVGPLEANAMSGRVSIDSPAGKALVGKRAGDDVTVNDGDQPLALEIVAIDAPREAD